MADDPRTRAASFLSMRRNKIVRLLLVGMGVGILAATSACTSSPASKSSTASSTSAPTASTSSTSSTSPPASTSTSATGTPAGNAQTCSSARLRLSLSGSQGAGGTNYAVYLLTNTGTSTCVLQGYPTVKLLDQNGVVVGGPASNTGPPITGAPQGVHLITIAPGKSAAFKLTYIENQPVGQCPNPTYGSSLSVIPPGATTPLTLQARVGACELAVGPIGPSS